MRRVNAVAATAAVAIGLFTGPVRADVTAFEGARLIVGNGSVVENGTLVIDGNKIVQAGQGVAVPAGATRVNLAGKTVMPAIIDTHVHLSANARKADPRLEAARLLRRRRRHEHGHRQLYELMLESATKTIPGAARFFSAGRGITTQGADASAPHQIDDRGGGPQGGAGQRRAARSTSSRSGSTTGDGKVQKVTPEQYAADHRRGAQGRHPRRRAHLQHGGRQGTDARQSRRLRARRSRQGRRRRDSWRCSSSVPISC